MSDMDVEHRNSAEAEFGPKMPETMPEECYLPLFGAICDVRVYTYEAAQAAYTAIRAALLAAQKP